LAGWFIENHSCRTGGHQNVLGTVVGRATVVAVAVEWVAQLLTGARDPERTADFQTWCQRGVGLDGLVDLLTADSFRGGQALRRGFVEHQSGGAGEDEHVEIVAVGETLVEAGTVERVLVQFVEIAVDRVDVSGRDRFHGSRR